MRKLLLVYHLFWAISSINGFLWWVAMGEQNTLIALITAIFGILSMVAFLGFLFKFANKILLYSLSLFLNVYLIGFLFWGQVTKAFWSFAEWGLVIFVAFIGLKTFDILKQCTLRKNSN